jgi:NADH-quinone oxidoreductase subunit L
MSQIGYMFLALGVGAWSAAIFHLMTHAFFKALLFLSAGIVINALHHERDMHKMGGLRRQLPFVFWSFLIGAASLSALPLITAGFYSKDMILWAAWAAKIGNGWLWTAGLVGALITSVYAFRMVFLIFYGKADSNAEDSSGLRIRIPLALLAALSLASGFIQIPDTLGNLPVFSNFLESSLPPLAVTEGLAERPLLYISAVVSLSGVFIAYILFLYNPQYVKNFVSKPFGFALHCFLSEGWNFDQLYNTVFVRPFVILARINSRDCVDLLYTLIASLNIFANRILSASQNGLVRRYAVGIAVGAIIIIGMVALK